MKRLIINADDFGLTPGINAAVIELNRAGALSSSTLMAAGPCFSEAVHLAFAQTTLGTGCHIVLTDGAPVSFPGDIPSLIDPEQPRSGQFRPRLTAFIADLLRGRIRESEIEQEAVAQIRRIQSAGLHVTHVDTHKHTHLFRRVLRPLLRAAQTCGVGAIRNPFEPDWSLRATPGSPKLRKLQVLALRVGGAGFPAMVRKAALWTTDGTVGMLATGSLDHGALRSLLRAAPNGTWELVCHPGYHDHALDKTRTRLRAARETERKALSDVVPEELQNNPSLSLIRFDQIGVAASDSVPG